MQALLDQLDRRSLVLVLVGVLSIVVALLGSRLIAPEFKAYKKEKRSLEIIGRLRGGQQDASGEIARLRGEVDRLSHQMHGTLPDMPLKQLEVYIMGQLQTISWENNVELVSVKPGLNQNILVFQEISLAVDVQGKYHDIHRWLWSLGNQLGFMVVKQFEITPTSFEEPNPDLKLRSNIVFYREVEK